jgi:DNA-binding protein HU-beta
MSDRIDKKELVRRVAERVVTGTGTVEEIVDAMLEEIYEALKQGECVSLRNFGTFYVRPERGSWVFKFNPSQRLRKLFGWSSTYKGKVKDPGPVSAGRKGVNEATAPRSRKKTPRGAKRFPKGRIASRCESHRARVATESDKRGLCPHPELRVLSDRKWMTKKETSPIEGLASVA